jgi:hypothetical protein
VKRLTRNFNEETSKGDERQEETHDGSMPWKNQLLFLSFINLFFAKIASSAISITRDCYKLRPEVLQPKAGM